MAKRFPRPSVRLSLALLVGAAAIATVAILASSGSAQSPPTTLHLVEKSQNKVGFFPRHRPHQGDRFGFGDKLSGDDTGLDRGLCTVIGGKSLCALGDAAIGPVISSVKKFRKEYEHHITQKTCLPETTRYRRLDTPVGAH